MELYEALGAKLVKSFPTDVGLYEDYDERFNALTRLNVFSYLVEFPNGVICMLVPCRYYKEGRISQSWTFAPKPDNIFNPVIDILLLHDDKWVCLLKKPVEAEKWPAVPIRDMVERSSLLELCEKKAPDHINISVHMPGKFDSESCEIKLNELNSIIKLLRIGNHHKFADILSEILEDSKS